MEEKNIIFEENSKRGILVLIFVILVVGMSVLVGGFYFYIKKSELEKPTQIAKYQPLLVPKDLFFSQGFKNTGHIWPPKNEPWSKEFAQNPLCRLREIYCERVEYGYADFACDCFSFQYYDSFNTYTDDQEKFTVYYPKLWFQNQQNINSNFISKTKLSLNRSKASCYLIYGSIDEKVLLSESRASRKIINIEGQELLQITIPFNRELSNEEKAAGYTNLTLIAIPHFPYPESKFGFLVTSGEKQPLLEACVNEFSAILHSRIIDYPSAKLTAQSNGILSIQRSLTLFKGPSDPQQKIRLLFENAKTGREEAIALDLFSKIEELNDPFLTSNKLFYLEGQLNNPIIRALDIFTGENEIIPLAYDKDNPIHSFFIDGDILYYLSGKFCNEYLARCSLDLKRYNMKSKTTEHLASKLRSRQIEGFNASRDMLILKWSEGDAQCLLSEYEGFEFQTNSIVNIGSYSFCEGDKQDPRVQFQNLLVGVKTYPYLVIKDGTIFLPSKIKDLQHRIPIKVHLSEYREILQ